MLTEISNYSNIKTNTSIFSEITENLFTNENTIATKEEN